MSWIKKTVQAPFMTVWWTSETLYGKNSDKKALLLVKDLLYNEQWLVCFPVSGCGFSDIFTRDNVISILAAEASANANFSTGSGKQACDVMKYIWNAVTGKRASPNQFFTNPYMMEHYLFLAPQRQTPPPYSEFFRCFVWGFSLAPKLTSTTPSFALCRHWLRKERPKIFFHTKNRAQSRDKHNTKKDTPQHWQVINFLFF